MIFAARIIVSVFVLMLALTGPASAFIFPIISGVIASLLAASPLLGPLTAAGIAVGVAANAVTGALIIGGLIGAQLLFGARPQAQSLNPGALKETFSTTDGPELNAVGRVRMSGMKAFGNTNDPDRYRVILQCKGPISGVENYYLGGREVIVNPHTGQVETYPYVTGLGTNYVKIKDKIGDGTETAWAELITAFPTQWTSDHRIRGIAQSLVDYISPGITSSKFLQLYQGGVPNLEKLFRAALVYDPRTETTAWSDNGILCALHMLLTFPEITLDLFDIDHLCEQADAADALVAVRGGGFEARARAWGVWSSEQKRSDALADLLRSIGAEIVARGDGSKFSIAFVDDDRTGEITIPAQHITQLVWKSGPDAVERPNVCGVKYYSPEHIYVLTDISLQAFDDDGVFIGPAWARVQSEIDAYGEKRLDLELPFCPSAPQAQRIARQLFARARADSGTITTNQYGLAAWGCKTVDIEMPDELGTFTAAVAPPKDVGHGEVEIPYALWPVLAPWDTAVDEVDPPEQLPSFQAQRPLDTPDPPDAAIMVDDVNGPRLRVHFTLPADAGDPGPGLDPAPTAAEVVYRKYTAGLPSPWFPMHEYFGATGYLHAYVDDDVTGVTIDVRVRSFDGANGVSDFSTILNVTPVEDNTAPVAAITGQYNIGADQFELTANITGLAVVTAEFTGDGAPGAGSAQDCLPDQQFIWTSGTGLTPGDYTFTAQGFTTDATASNLASITLTKPP